MNLITALELGSFVKRVNQYGLENNSWVGGVVFWASNVFSKIVSFQS